MEENGLELYPHKKLQKSTENRSFYEVKPVPDENPLTHLATHAKKFGSHNQKFQKINPNVLKCHFFTVMKWNIIAIYDFMIEQIIESCPAQPILNQSL